MKVHMKDTNVYVNVIRMAFFDGGEICLTFKEEAQKFISAENIVKIEHQ